MTVTLFGATGRTGRLLLDIAGRRGWPARAFVRDPGKLAPRPGVTVFSGDARDDAAIAPAIAGTGAVLCCLGMHDISQPATDFSDSVRAIVRAMQTSGVRRIVAIASAGVLDAPGGGYVNQQPGFPSYLANVSLEHQRNLASLRDSGLDWTLMCPMTLVDDLPAGHAQTAFDALPPGSSETGYADLALAMADVLLDRASLRRRVGIVSLRPQGHS
jgi:uncharacterized protein